MEDDLVLKEEGEVHRRSSSDQKLELFRELFHGRWDVFAVRWENEKTGKPGYSPSCENDFDQFVCRKPKVKCSECKYQKFHPFSKEFIRDHIQGKTTIGIFPMLLDETCTFLAIDLDKSGWSEDAKAIRNTCLEMEIFPAIERSRSGNGAHVWIFFEEPISAAMARNLGTLILTRTMKKYRLSMDSYDRFFPNQDTLPRGRFGNLIAFPFQGKPSSKGNSLFLDELRLSERRFWGSG